MPRPAPADRDRPRAFALDFERLPPFNIEAEMGVLGSMLLDPDAAHEVLPVLAEGDFYRDEHATVYRLIREAIEAGRPLDVIALNEELVRRDLFDAVGGNEALVDLIESVPHAAHALYYADIVRQKAISRDLIEAAHEILRDGYSNNFTGQELADRAEKAVFAVGDARVERRVKTLRDAVAGSMRRLQVRMGGELPGLRTGLLEFDQKVGGLQPGHLVVLASRPSIGKTSLALNIADFVGTDRELATLVISLEMTDEELADRALCARAEVEGGKFAAPADLLGGDDWESLRRAARRYDGSRVFLDDAPSQDVDRIAALGRRFRARERIELLVVDYLQLVEPSDAPRNTPRHELVSRMTRALKNLAKSLNIPVLLLCQLNREVEKREDKRPQLADLRESGAIEQDANMVLLLHRPEFYDEKVRPGEADLIIAKNRGGPTGTVKLAFDKRLTKFSDWSEPLPPVHELAPDAPY